jgi:hypothetical protein
VTLSDEYWRHILFRHPEVVPHAETILKVIEEPDEVYIDERNGIHGLKRIDSDHFLVVIYEIEENNEGFIRTAYMINERRKNRRYSELRSMKQS